MCGRIWTPPDCNGLAGSGSVITIADVYPVKWSYFFNQNAAQGERGFTLSVSNSHLIT